MRVKTRKNHHLHTNPRLRVESTNLKAKHHQPITTQKITTMKPGSKDIKAYLKFEEAELGLLQENTGQMAESFGLDRRIGNLTGKRKVGFYAWDSECLEMVVDKVKTDKDSDQAVVAALRDKIKNAMDYIYASR